MKIYTKTGDSGNTSLFGGTRVAKNHIRIESYGTLDELNAYLGILRDVITDARSQSFIIEIQKDLFVIGAQLATENDKAHKLKIEAIQDVAIEKIESEIDFMNESLTPMTHFILPGGHPTVSYCHIARCVCRRAERNMIHLNQLEQIDQNTIKYINRLSDYLFVLARKITADYGVTETPWIPKKL